MSGVLLPAAGGLAEARGWRRGPGGLLLPPSSAALRRGRPVGVDLFAGAGGFSAGLHQAGYHMAAAVELDPVAALTYMINLARPGVKVHFDSAENQERFTRVAARHLADAGVGRRGAGQAPRARSRPKVFAGDGWIRERPGEPGCEHFWVADVRRLTGAQILAELGLEPGEVDVVCGGPPCQGFSRAGRQDVMDPRNSLVFEFARLVLEIRPKAVVMENVSAIATMLTPEGVPVLDALARVLADGGFGGYNALKAGLAAQAGSAGLLRGDTGPSAGKPGPARPAGDGEEPATGGEQLGLFDLGGAAGAPARSRPRASGRSAGVRGPGAAGGRARGR